MRSRVLVLRDRPARPDRATCPRRRSSSRCAQPARSLADGEVPGGPTRLSNVVFMGMGEPLANYKSVMETVRRLVAPTPDGLGMSARNVTVSTVGMVPAMDKLAKEASPSRWPCRCTRRTTSSAASSSR